MQVLQSERPDTAAKARAASVTLRNLSSRPLNGRADRDHSQGRGGHDRLHETARPGSSPRSVSVATARCAWDADLGRRPGAGARHAGGQRGREGRRSQPRERRVRRGSPIAGAHLDRRSEQRRRRGRHRDQQLAGRTAANSSSTRSRARARRRRRRPGRPAAARRRRIGSSSRCSSSATPHGAHLSVSAPPSTLG